MTKPNFANLNTAELRAYVLQHRDDQEAFYALADRVRQMGIKLHPDEPLTEVIASRQKMHPDQPDQ